MSNSSGNSSGEESNKRNRRKARVNYAQLAGEESGSENEDTVGKTNDDATQQGSVIHLKKKKKPKTKYYGNRHVPTVLHRKFEDSSKVVQVVVDGRTLTGKSIREGKVSHMFVSHVHSLSQIESMNDLL